MGKDGNVRGSAADEGKGLGPGGILVVTVGEVVAAGIVAEAEGVVCFFTDDILGLGAVALCHMEGDAAFP